MALKLLIHLVLHESTPLAGLVSEKVVIKVSRWLLSDQDVFARVCLSHCVLEASTVLTEAAVRGTIAEELGVVPVVLGMGVETQH